MVGFAWVYRFLKAYLKTLNKKLMLRRRASETNVGVGIEK